MFSRWLHVLAAGVALLAACSSGSGAGASGDGGAADAGTDDGSDDATDENWASSGGIIDTGSGGPYPNTDAPSFALDGCALLNVTCVNDSFCCSGHCIQGVCTMQGHPGHGPPQ